MIVNNLGVNPPGGLMVGQQDRFGCRHLTNLNGPPTIGSEGMRQSGRRGPASARLGAIPNPVHRPSVTLNVPLAKRSTASGRKMLNLGAQQRRVWGLGGEIGRANLTYSVFADGSI